MTTTKPSVPIGTSMATALAPLVSSMPEAARQAYDEGRRIRDLDPAERLAREELRREAERQQSRAEMLTGRAAHRWTMWCQQVPAIYRDDRANPEQRDQRDYAWWLSRLAVDQHATKIAAWLANPQTRTLWLIGPTGTGKTHAAISAGYAAAAAAVHARYVSQLDYLRMLRPGGSDEPNRVRERYATTSLLILDDFGAETGDASQFVRQELLSLLDDRLSEGRRQIITTNAGAEELADTFGDRIMSRLRADAAVLKYAGEDRRTARTPW